MGRHICVDTRVSRKKKKKKTQQQLSPWLHQDSSFRIGLGFGWEITFVTYGHDFIFFSDVLDYTESDIKKVIAVKAFSVQLFTSWPLPKMKGWCFVCSTNTLDLKERILALSCCGRYVHETCLEDKFGALSSKQETRCPSCDERFVIRNMFTRSDRFTVMQTKMMERAFALHYSEALVSMTKSEIRGIMKALNTRGIDSTRHVSYRVFVVGAAFWFPLVRSNE